MVRPLSDGLLVMRYLLGTFPGDSLTTGAISPTATRNATQIRAYIQEGIDLKVLDIDANGSIGAASDGTMLLRHLFGSFPGQTVYADIISPNATRTGTAINDYLGGLAVIN